MESIIFLILGIVGALFLIDIALVFYCLKLKKRLDLFSGGGEKSLEEFVRSQIKKLERQEGEIKKIFGEVSRLGEISQRSFQKVGVVRFNPFNEVGGDQSFCVALLDAQNNGFVISSLYGRQMNRVYAKPVEKGFSKYQLSEEEKGALEKATS